MHCVCVNINPVMVHYITLHYSTVEDKQDSLLTVIHDWMHYPDNMLTPSWLNNASLPEINCSQPSVVGKVSSFMHRTLSLNMIMSL